MSEKIYSRRIEIYKEMILDVSDIDDESMWITIKWFFDLDYEEQEKLNDDSEIFADLVRKDAFNLIRIIQEGGKNKKEEVIYLPGTNYYQKRILKVNNLKIKK